MQTKLKQQQASLLTVHYNCYILRCH